MINSDFVHLHVHSEYSLLDGLGSPQQYAEHAAEMGFQAIAVTDHGNIDSHLEWQNACKKAGVQPLLGCELNIVQDMGKKERGEARFLVGLRDSSCRPSKNLVYRQGRDYLSVSVRT